MKEITVNITDDSSGLVIERVERSGSRFYKKEKINKELSKLNNKPQKKATQSEKRDHENKDGSCSLIGETEGF